MLPLGGSVVLGATAPLLTPAGAGSCLPVTMQKCPGICAFCHSERAPSQGHVLTKPGRHQGLIPSTSTLRFSQKAPALPGEDPWPKATQLLPAAGVSRRLPTSEEHLLAELRLPWTLSLVLRPQEPQPSSPVPPAPRPPARRG